MDGRYIFGISLFICTQYKTATSSTTSSRFIMHPTGRVKHGETSIRRLLHPKNRGKALSMRPVNRKKPCGARLFGQRKNANLCIKISVLLWRRVRDSNPGRFYPHSISSAAPSTARTTLQNGSSAGRPIYYKAYRTRLSSGNHICAARSTISIERRMNSVICSVSSG